jgi:hypothetical protein
MILTHNTCNAQHQFVIDELSVDLGDRIITTTTPQEAWHRYCVMSRAIAEVGSDDWLKYYEGVMQSQDYVQWCGIFTLWILHQCGLHLDKMWELGRGYLYRLPLTNYPNVGDIAYFAHNQHHAIIYDVCGDTGWYINGNGTGRKVTASQSPLWRATSFYKSV